MGVGDGLYSDTASFGKLMALISAIIVTLLAVAAIIGSIVFMMRKDNKEETTGTVTNVQPYPCVLIDNNTYQCNVTVTYSVGNASLSNTVWYSGNMSFFTGENVKVWYDPNNPANISLSAPTPKWVGWIIIAVAVFVSIGSWFWVWATRKYKFAAAGAGVAGVAGLFNR